MNIHAQATVLAVSIATVVYIMAPQKKDKKDGKAGKKSGKEKILAIIDGMSVSDMTKEQLEGHVTRLHDELDKEREERNFYQIERDKMQTFWDVTKQQLQKTKAELQNKERDLEEVEEKHLAEIRVYKQRVKHILHEHQCKLSELKMESLVTLKDVQQKFEQKETVLNEDKANLNKKLRDDDIAHEQRIHTLQLKHSEETANLRIELQQRMSEFERDCNLKFKAAVNDIEQRGKVELSQMEAKKSQQMKDLVSSHEKAFTDMKNYYNDITVNNLALITTLKEQIDATKKKDERTRKRMAELQLENRRLVEPLQKALHDVTELNKKMTKYERDKALLANSTVRLKNATDEIKDLKWEIEVLEQKFKQLQSERDDMHNKFVSAIQQVQQKSSFKNVLLEHKLQTLEGMLEQKDTALQQVLTSCNVDTNTVNAASEKIEEILRLKDSAINKLQTELTNLKKTQLQFLP